MEKIRLLVSRIIARSDELGFHRSYLTAGAVAGVLALWVVSGIMTDLVFGFGQRSEPTPSDSEFVRVAVSDLTSSPYHRILVMNGRTEPARIVQLRAETDGTVASVPIPKGAFVTAGEVICQLSEDARRAQLAEAEAVMNQRQLEFDAARKLKSQGHRSEVQVAAANAAYDAAQAAVKRMETELANTRIAAPFDGLLDERPAELGDYLNKGDTCGTVVELDPLLIVGHVSEREINALSVGLTGTAELVSGGHVNGHIRYVSKNADANSRTFRVELQVPNPDGILRGGLTAMVRIPLSQVQAHRISPAILSLDDDGRVGVRLVDPANIVHFHPVDIAGDGPDGVWITGLPESVRVITVGQDFVKDGERVEPISEAVDGPAVKAAEEEANS